MIWAEGVHDNIGAPGIANSYYRYGTYNLSNQVNRHWLTGDRDRLGVVVKGGRSVLCGALTTGATRAGAWDTRMCEGLRAGCVRYGTWPRTYHGRRGMWCEVPGARHMGIALLNDGATWASTGAGGGCSRRAWATLRGDEALPT
ncbi:hypothetical protein [Streptomyces sp. NPDC048665]|uniref:hypothetical protein n=1 Tax=Streptomyces sp. NPDC048665 TaxID=3155490 RepID=UPI003436378A